MTLLLPAPPTPLLLPARCPARVALDVVVCSDALDFLRGLPSGSVNCVVTSPPYFGLRDYGVAGQWGLEATPQEHVAKIVALFREVRRVLRDDGVLWVNYGDSYTTRTSGDGWGNYEWKTGGKVAPANGTLSTIKRDREELGLSSKNLLGMPWRIAFGLQDDGWILRSDVIWAKPNPMPESVQGSHFSRHRVTIAEYEKLSSLQQAKRKNKDGASDLSGLPSQKISDSQTPLPEERQGTSHDAGKGTTPGREGKTENSSSDSSAQSQRPKTSKNSQGSGIVSKEIGELPDTSSQCRRDSNGRGLDQDTGTAQLPLLLLPQEMPALDDGSCNSVEQGRKEYTGEHSAGLSELQLEEEGQVDSTLLVDCPGCPKCEKWGGYIPHLSAGRPTKSHEYVFLFSKSGSYWYDADGVREPSAASTLSRDKYDRNQPRSANLHHGEGYMVQLANTETKGGRNLRSVWTIPTEPFAGAHFATFPQRLVERCILAGCPPKVCASCGAPWVREVEAKGGTIGKSWHDHKDDIAVGMSQTDGTMLRQAWQGGYHRIDKGWHPTCACHADTSPGLVLDPFIGSGTVGLVARRLGRHFIGSELNPEYVKLCNERLAVPYTLPLPLTI